MVARRPDVGGPGGLSSDDVRRWDDDEFRPSGIDRIPGSYRNLLVAASPIRSAKIDLDGAVFHVRQLARDRHWQVEGIAIMPDSTLILADEGAGRRGRLAVYGFSGTVRP